MTGEQFFAVAALLFVIFVVVMGFVAKNQYWVRLRFMDRLITSLKAFLQKPKSSKSKSKVSKVKPQASEPLVDKSERKALTTEQKSEVELERLQQLVEGRMQFAKDTDISHHLWNLYKNHFRFTSPQSLDPLNQTGELYGVRILQASTKDNLNIFEFELRGARYKFIDDEETRTSSVNMKVFSLLLFDDSDNCLIEIPMAVKVDKLSRRYSVLSGGPNAFQPGEWTHDFINATLIHQSNRNKESRAQKHQERLWEIEDLKNRYGISE